MASTLVKSLCRIAACCLLSPGLLPAGTLPRDDGPVGFGSQDFTQPEEWRELAVQLPDWPREDRLIELEVNTAGAPFEIFIDPESVSVGEDRVVRFSSVLVSSSGVWNVTYEGLHCGERSYRRFAYGVNGRWHELPDAGWEPLTTRGSGRYRYVLYDHFMCNPTRPQYDAGRIVRDLRHPPRRLGD